MTFIGGITTAIETPAERLERLTKEAEELNNTAKQLKTEEKNADNLIKKWQQLE